MMGQHNAVPFYLDKQMKIDITKAQKAGEMANRWKKIFNDLELKDAQTVMEHVVFPLLNKYMHLYNDKEYKPLFPYVIDSLYRWCKGRTFEDRQYGKHGYREISTRAHAVANYTIIVHDKDFLTHEESYGGQSGSYWMHDTQSNALWYGKTPHHFDDYGFFIRYDLADLDDTRTAFEEYYFAKVNAEYRKTKQLDLF